MRLLFINPNATEAMTDSIAETARAVMPEAEILAWTNHAGPPAIQGAEDGAKAVPGLLDLLPDAEAAGADALIIACFDDTGLEEMRARATCPVIGIGQAAYHMAALSTGGFSVLTTLPVSTPVIEENVARFGMSDICDGVHASGIPVLDVEIGSDETLDSLERQVADLSATGAHSIILGCAGMSRHRAQLQRAASAPVIDPVAAATLLAAALARARSAS